MEYILIFIVLVAALLLISVIYFYNKLVAYKHKVKEAWSSIDIQLKRRYDLIPNLVEVAKGYATHEKDIFEEISANRAASIQASSVSQQAASENMLTASLGKLFSVVENYPDLKANDNFLQIQQALLKIEEEIQMARRYYNALVRDNNTNQEKFPGVLFARLFNFKPYEFFETDTQSKQNVNIKF